MTRDEAVKELAEAAREAVVLWSVPDWPDAQNAETSRRAQRLKDALDSFDATEPWPMPPEPLENTPPDAWGQNPT